MRNITKLYEFMTVVGVLLIVMLLTSCSGIGEPPSSYTAKIYPIENDYERFETHGPFSTRDECTAKAQELNAAAYSCDPADPPPAE